MRRRGHPPTLNRKKNPCPHSASRGGASARASSNPQESAHLHGQRLAGEVGAEADQPRKSYIAREQSERVQSTHHPPGAVLGTRPLWASSLVGAGIGALGWLPGGRANGSWRYPPMARSRRLPHAARVFNRPKMVAWLPKGAIARLLGCGAC